MKKSFIAVGFCILVVFMPVGYSTSIDCGCTLPENHSLSSSDAPWITEADILALQQQGIDEGGVMLQILIHGHNPVP